MAKKTISVRIEESELDKLQKSAAQRGIDLSEGFREAVHLWSSFDDRFWKKLKNFSTGMELPAYLVLQNLATAWIARRIAKKAVYGPTIGPIHEFRNEVETKGEKVIARPITGDALEKNLVERYTIHAAPSRQMKSGSRSPG